MADPGFYFIKKQNRLTAIRHKARAPVPLQGQGVGRREKYNWLNLPYLCWTNHNHTGFRANSHPPPNP